MGLDKDYLGEPLYVGDKVIFVELRYRNFHKGVISKITDKMVIIDHERTNAYTDQTRQLHSQVIKY